jgi:hypothetical protein
MVPLRCIGSLQRRMYTSSGAKDSIMIGRRNKRAYGRQAESSTAQELKLYGKAHFPTSVLSKRLNIRTW